ncbi:uncharacterized protein ATC70_006419 [Mucor velutinosus]|uniref:Wax synthase domain-containing protein n=1 Tax=Mucor velutinosus TaxID=708070 RepID=A0AAN7DP23_9FUNG|nr:hypothetical protein ATC70_006419 [Mucor velutinosus]
MDTSNQRYASYVVDIKLPPAITVPAGTLTAAYTLVLTLDYVLVKNDAKFSAIITPMQLRALIAIYHFLIPIIFASKYNFGNISFMLYPWSMAAQIIFLSTSSVTLKEYLQTLFKVVLFLDDSPTAKTHQQIRFDGVKKIARGFAKMLFMKFALDGVLPDDLSDLLAMPFYSPRAMFITYVLAVRIYCMMSLVDILMGVLQATLLIRFHDLFDNPFLATSPKDFWNRRWNRMVKNFFRKLIFSKANTTLDTKDDDKKKKKQGFMSSPTAFGLLTFFISGLFHDFMIAAAAREITFELTVFFLIHGIEVALEVKYRKGKYKQDPTGITAILCNLLTVLFFVTTGRIFLSPVLRQEVFLNIAQKF